MIAGSVSGIRRVGNENGGIVPPWIGDPVPVPEPIVPTPLPGPKAHQAACADDEVAG